MFPLGCRDLPDNITVHCFALQHQEVPADPHDPVYREHVLQKHQYWPLEK